MSHLRHILVAAAATAAAACAFSASARAAAICGEGIYSYAGFDGAQVTRGVRAEIGQAGALDVRTGHVAGWIGVVDPSTDAAWLQVGLAAFPGDATSRVYYEVAVPGGRPVFHEVHAAVTTGIAHRFAVLELRTRPSWWRVWMDGRPVTEPLHLSGSHLRWKAQVLGESWAGTQSGACNRYAYSFQGVSGRLGKPQHDPNYAVFRRSSSSFIAGSVDDLALRQAAASG